MKEVASAGVDYVEPDVCTAAVRLNTLVAHKMTRLYLFNTDDLIWNEENKLEADSEISSHNNKKSYRSYKHCSKIITELQTLKIHAFSIFSVSYFINAFKCFISMH